MTVTKEKDFGTPKSISENTVTLNVDGRDVIVPEGTSIMRAAAKADIDIPSLCATDCVKSYGSCRLCVVEVEGKSGYKASCHTLVEEGMKVKTQTDKLAKLRKNIMELYISDHPLDCLTCDTNGDCELQDMAGIVGLREVRYKDNLQTHLNEKKDETNPYFSFDPSKCIVCAKCVRVCEEVQGSFALTIEGRGFDSKVSVGKDADFIDSDCVSCGACVSVCPTDSLIEKSVVREGLPEDSVITTCAYCGVGCSLKVELKGEEVIRMTPYKNGGANEGHACVKGRFAWGYATHPDRLEKPMIRENITDPWREVSWDEALSFAASSLKKTQEKYGVKSIGAIASSRCSLEETYLVQKLARACFGNNNVDNCARVCHAPTGYGLSATLGTSAGTQHFASIEEADVILVVGANPTEAHPVFGSRIKKCIRGGAKIIVVDPRKIELVNSPHVEATHHLALKPGANVALLNSFAHVILSESLEDKNFIEAQCDQTSFDAWKTFILSEKNKPEIVADIAGVSVEEIKAAARLYATAPNAAIYYGLGVSEHSQGSVGVMALANLAMLTGNLGRNGVGVSPLRGQNNVQGACDVGGFPHQFPGYRHVSDDKTREIFEKEWGVELSAEPGLRIPNMIDEACAGNFKGIYIQGEDIVQSDPNAQHIVKGLKNMDCVIVHDIFLNETSKYAHVVLPGSSFLEKDGTFINAERRINRVRKVMRPIGEKADWEGTVALANAMGYEMAYKHPSEVMDEIARTTHVFSGVSYDKLDALGSIQWPCHDQAPEGTPVMHVGNIVRNPGFFKLTEFIPTEEEATDEFPLLLTTGRILMQYNVGTQTRRTENMRWVDEDVLEIHLSDAEERGIGDGDLISIQSRTGKISLRAKISDRMQTGIVYTSFHFAKSATNVVTSRHSDEATECPEYKVTAVDVRKTNQLSDWQEEVIKSHKQDPRLSTDIKTDA